MRTYLFRSVGVFNLFFATVGLGALALQSWAFSLFPAEVTGGKDDQVRLAFRIAQFSSIVLFPAMAYLGAQLLRLRRKLIAPCAFLLIAEIVYLSLSRVLSPWIFSSGILDAMRSGLLNTGFGLQIVTGYPLLGLIALYFVQKDARSTDAPS